MKMNERCERRIAREHSSVLSFRDESESFLLRCSAFLIKFNARLSQLQPINSLHLALSVSLPSFSSSLASSSAALLCQRNFISGVAVKCDLWRGARVQRTVTCVRACVWLSEFSCACVCRHCVSVLICIYTCAQFRLTYNLYS